MSFTVQKSLGNSMFRFAVGRRRDFRSIDADTGLSTGPSGEFIRHRPELFYSADLRAIRNPEWPPPRSIASTPFRASMIDRTPRGWTFLGMMILGAILILIGFAVLAGKGPQGWVEVILGGVLLAVPFAVTGQQRRAVRLVEERKRREREERDARNRELLAAYTGALETLRENPGDENLEQVRRENEKLDLPYAVWADIAIATVLHVGFSTLARVGPERAAEVAALMDRASEAAGLIAEDATGVKHALYSTVLWHFLADDRLGKAQLEIVRQIQKGFAIADAEIPNDVSAEQQFERLRGIDHRNFPRCEAPIPLGLNESCMYAATVTLPGDGSPRTIYVTNRRFIAEGDKATNVAVKDIDDIAVDADTNQVSVRAASLKRTVTLRAEEPIYLAAMLDLATRLDDRPKSFA